MILVSGDRRPVGAVSCNASFRDDGTFKSHRTRGDFTASIWPLMVVESAIPTTDWAIGFGLKIGAKVDFTTSIGSSSKSTDSFIFIASLFTDDDGLDDDSRDDVGDKRDVLMCSGIWFEMMLDSDVRLPLWWMWCIDGPFIDIERKLVKSYGENGWPNGWNGDGTNVFGRIAVPACGGIIVAAESVDKIVGCVGDVCMGLNSQPSVGGNNVAGIVPGNVGETANRNRIKKKFGIN